MLTGGADKAVQLFDLESSKVVATLKGHTKPVNHVAFGNGVAFSGSADKTVRIWGEDDGKWASRASLTGHKGEIVGLAVHPSGSYVGAASADSTWSLYDVETTKEIANYAPLEGFSGSFNYTSFGIHPDGVLVGAGTKDGLVRVWDARNLSSLAGTLETESGKPLSTLSFSENGYYLAAASNAEPTVNIFDLRKLQVISSWALPSENTISEVRFDTSAQFLSVTGTDLRVYANKSWEELLKFDDNASVLTGARFGALGKEIVTGGLDRTLRVLSKAE